LSCTGVINFKNSQFLASL